MKNCFKFFAVVCCMLTSTLYAGDSFFGSNNSFNSVTNAIKSLYIGGHVGIASHDTNFNDVDGLLTDNGSYSSLKTGVTKGLQAGIDWQFNQMVLGVVGEFESVGIDSQMRDNPNVAINNYVKRRFKSFYAGRIRAGLAVKDTIIYISAGPAVASFNTSWVDPTTVGGVFKFSNDKTGWIGTIGTESKIFKNVNVGGEIYTLHMGNQDKTLFAQPAATNFRFVHNDSLWGARFLVNFDYIK